MSTTPAAPAVARAIVATALPADVADAILGDLEELFSRQSAAHGVAFARRWYWREALSLSAAFAAERVRGAVARPRIRPERRGGLMSIMKDTRDAGRALVRRPLVTVAILASLALGIGANTAIFSILHALVLRPLPVDDPASLFQVVHSGDRGTFESSSYALYDHLARQQRTLEGALLVDASTMKVIVEGQAEAIQGQQVTGRYYELLGIQPRLGTLIQPRDEPGATPNRVAVLSHRYWTRRFGGDPGVLGRSIIVDQVPHTVIGVTPPEFFGLQAGRHVDVTVPIDGSDDRDYWQSKSLVVRLAPGVPHAQAEAEVNQLFLSYLAGDTRTSPQARNQAFRRASLSAVSAGLPEFRERYGLPLRAALAIVLALLLLACANLAGLFLARTAERRRELAVCMALGASRLRVSRRLLIEALLVSLGGGLLGVLVAWWGVDLLLGFLPDATLAADLGIRPDQTMLLFAFAASVVTGLGIGAAPAWLVGRVDPGQALAAGGRTIASGGAAFKSLVVAQVAVSSVLVVAATLFTTSLNNLRSQSLGFIADGVLMLTVDAGDTDLQEERLGAAQRDILEGLAALPGVTSATFATIPPVSANEDGKRLTIPGVTFTTPEDGVLQVNTVGPGFFETFGVRIVRGRGLAAADGPSAPKVAVVSESMARYYFPGVDAIGRRFDLGRGSGGQIEVVGIAEDVRYRDLRTPAPRMAYVPAFQREPEEASVFALRTSGDPAAWTAPAARVIARIAPSVPATDVTTLVRQRDRTLVTERLLSMLSLCFGALALALVGLGVYGVVAFSVSQRTPELGLRLALGASRTGLLWLVVREMLALVAFAGAVGLATAFAASSLVTSLLFGVQPAEPWVYAVTLAVLVTVGLAAALGPTIRASRVDPVETLRAH